MKDKLASAGVIGERVLCAEKKEQFSVPTYTRVQSLRQEDPLENEMATHSSILAWEIPWTEEPGGRQSMGSQELDTA